MGLLDKLFNTASDASKEGEVKKNNADLPWITLERLEQLESIKDASKTKTQFVFKHSTRCGISRMVMSQFKKEYQLTENEADLYYLDLLNHRDISNGIAEQFNVMHESPQLLVIKNGSVAAYESHSGINSMDLKSYV